MIRQLKDNEKKRITEYLKPYAEDCLYMYIDFTNYSIETDNCMAWVDETDDDINWILMWYYNSYQIFSEKNSNLNYLIDMLRNKPGKMISARKDTIELISPELTEYKVTYGEIYELNRQMKSLGSENVKWAKEEDALEIAKLVQTDFDIGAHYSLDSLAKQFADRISSKTGRNVIVEKDGLIIAHTATYAENSEFAVISGTVVHPDYRDTDSFLRVTSEIQSMLWKEGKKSYTFSTSEKMMRYHRRLHRKSGEYGKLELMEE